MTATLLLDDSARARLGDPALHHLGMAELAGALDAGHVATLDAGYSVHSGRDHDQTLNELLTPSPRRHRRGRRAARRSTRNRQLARVGHRRLPPVDPPVAAPADLHRLGMLHYTRDYDLMCEQMDLDFASAQGTL